VFDAIRNYLPYSYLKRAVPQYDAAGRHSISVNQDSGQSLYPFADPEGINAGYVANIDVVFHTTVKRPVFLSHIERSCGLLNPEDYDWKTMTAQDWLSAGNFPNEDIPDAYTHIQLSDGDNLLLDTFYMTRVSVTERNGIKSYLWMSGDATMYYAEYLTANEFTKPFLFPRLYTGLIELIPRCYHVKAQPVTASDYGKIVHLNLKAGQFTNIEEESNVITINADVPDRVENKTILTSINGFNADTSGSMVINTDQCIRFEPHVSKANTILFNDDCTPCCTCDNYMLMGSQQQQLAEHVKLKINRLNELKHKVMDAYDKYNEIIAIKRSKLSEIFIECGQTEATLWLNIYNPETVDFNRPLDIAITLTTDDADSQLYLTGQNAPDDTVFENNVIKFTLTEGIEAGSSYSAAFLLKIYTTLPEVNAQAGLLITNNDQKYAPFIVAEGTFTRKREIVSSSSSEVLIPDSTEPEPIINYQCPESVTVEDMTLSVTENNLNIGYKYAIEMEDGLKLVTLKLRRYIYGLNVIKDDDSSAVGDLPNNSIVADGSYSNAQLSEYILTSETAIDDEGELYYTGLDAAGDISEIIPIHKLVNTAIPATVKIEIHFDMIIETPDTRKLHCVASQIMTTVLQT
jgi:hypothetical protein